MPKRWLQVPKAVCNGELQLIFLPGFARLPLTLHLLDLTCWIVCCQVTPYRISSHQLWAVQTPPPGYPLPHGLPRQQAGTKAGARDLANISRSFEKRTFARFLVESFVARYHSTAPVRYSVQPRFYSRFLWEIWFVWHFFDCDTQSLKHMKLMLFLEFQTSFLLLNSDN